MPGKGLGTRLLSAAVLIPLALAVAWLGGGWLAGFVALCLVGLILEWMRLLGEATARAETALLIIGALGGLGLTASGAVEAGIAAAMGAGLGAGLVGLARDRDGFWILMGACYLVLPGLAVLWIRGQPDGFVQLVWLFVVVWTTDTGSFLVGRLIGGPAFAPRSSPNKTWAGVLGGIGLAVLAGGVAGAMLAPAAADGPRALFEIHPLCLALVISGCTQAGDIVESALKRHFGVKDSGALIPGHGGLLDRLDGFLFASMMLALAMALGRAP